MHWYIRYISQPLDEDRVEYTDDIQERPTGIIPVRL